MTFNKKPTDLNLSDISDIHIDGKPMKKTNFKNNLKVNEDEEEQHQYIRIHER